MNIEKSLYLLCIMTCTAKTAMECICIDQFICPDLQLGLPVSSYVAPPQRKKTRKPMKKIDHSPRSHNY
jgi:hypothetical protein